MIANTFRRSFRAKVVSTATQCGLLLQSAWAAGDDVHEKSTQGALIEISMTEVEQRKETSPATSADSSGELLCVFNELSSN